MDGSLQPFFMSKQPLFFAALVPPKPFRQQAWEMKEYFRDEYHSKASMNSPPHITLHPPFKLEQGISEEELLQVLEEVASGCKPFEVRLKGFGAFRPRVIFIGVEKQPPMEMLQQAVVEGVRPLAQAEKKRPEPSFHPHMTLAFRDLSKANFQRAWQEYEPKKLSYSWEVTHFVLLKHNGKHWNEHQFFKLQH